MKQLIAKTLETIERENHIRILYAVESGSRAWGFASPDSDYDVRYIYLRRREDYLRIDPFKDTIEGPLDDVLDFSGWDIRKALQLLKKTNPSLMEWVQSPIVYRTSPIWEELAAEFPQFFSVKKNMFHYLSMTATNWGQMQGTDQVKLKRYLYTLRALLSCHWLEKFGTVPPIEFAVLCQAVLPKELEQTVAELLRRKQALDEKGLTPRFPALDCFIQEEMKRLQAMVATLPEAQTGGYDLLNAMFLAALDQAEKDA